MSVVLPFGLSWFPSKDDKKYIVVRIADPFRRSKTITNYKKIPTDCDLNEFINELTAYRDELGRELWEDWPDVARPRKAGVLSSLPKGVSCSFVHSTIKNKKEKVYIFVTAYWQDYKKPKNKKGQFRQSKKTYRLPVDSPEWLIQKTVREAKEYRENQLKANPKPPRES